MTLIIECIKFLWKCVILKFYYYNIVVKYILRFKKKKKVLFINNFYVSTYLHFITSVLAV